MHNRSIIVGDYFPPSRVKIPSRPLRKPKRVDRRESVTIAAGFKFKDGILLCADTQHTYSAVMKLQGTKIYQFHFPLAGNSQAAFVVAGRVSYAKMAIAEMDRALAAIKPKKMTKESMRVAIEGVLVRIYREHIWNRPDFSHNGANFALLVALWSHVDGLGLFFTDESAITEISAYECLGAGSYLAHYLAKSSYSQDKGLVEIVATATLILEACMEHVDGCGGTAEFMRVSVDGKVNPVKWYTHPTSSEQDRKKIVEALSRGEDV